MSMKHETIGIRIYDPVEDKLPRVGKVNLLDPETGFQSIVNTNNSNVRMGYKKLNRRRLEALNKTFTKYKISHVSAATGQDYLPALHQLFKK